MRIVFLDVLTVADLTTELARFADLGTFVSYETTPAGQTVDRLAGATVAITNKVVLGRAELDQLPDLRLICIAATGTNNVDLAAAAERGIPVRNVAGYSTESVAQHTFGLLFALLGDLAHLNDAVYDGTYTRHPAFAYWRRPFPEIAGKRWGVIGLGTIGRRVAELATAFGAEVVYHSTSGRNTTGQPYPHLSLTDLLSTSDVITLHCPLNEQTTDLLGADELRQLKPTACLINVARGGVVNETALVNALNAGHLAGAAADVFTTEPLPADHPYLRIEDRSRLLLTPHVAWASIAARKTLLAAVYQHIHNYLHDGDPAPEGRLT